MLKRILTIMCLLLLVTLPALAEWEEIPDVLRFSQNTRSREEVRDKVYIQRTYPETANAAVNEEMRGVIDRLAEENRGALPTGKIKNDKSYLKVASNITRTGTRWMSFLTLARVKDGYEQTDIAFDARVYDMETGRALTLGDLFPEGSEAWGILADEIRAQLTAYFPGLEPDAETLERLCGREAIESAAFTLTPGSLRLHYAAGELYEGRAGTLMHVLISYRSLSGMMTEEAARQTDNSRYKLIALTFDDGPAHSYSLNVIETLQKYGAQGTFFLIGERMYQGHYVIAYEHAAGHSVAYHSYTHKTSGVISPLVQPEWAKFQAEIREIIGTVPKVMRAPGGYEAPYVNMEVGIPIIHWSMASGDGNGGENEATDAFIRQRIDSVCGNARNGGVVLMHDLRVACSRYLEPILQYLEKHNYLCVTVEELFDLCGTELMPNTVYYGAEK